MLCGRKVSISYKNWYPLEGGDDKREGERDSLIFIEKNKAIQQLNYRNNLWYE